MTCYLFFPTFLLPRRADPGTVPPLPPAIGDGFTSASLLFWPGKGIISNPRGDLLQSFFIRAMTRLSWEPSGHSSRVVKSGWSSPLTTLAALPVRNIPLHVVKCLHTTSSFLNSRSGLPSLLPIIFMVGGRTGREILS